MQVKKALWCAPILLLFLFSNGCRDVASPEEPYESILFKRDGGGNKEFYVTTDATHEIFFNVVKYDFNDTNYTESVFISDDGALSDLISRILNNKENITGTFNQPESKTGTGASLFVVAPNNRMTEITNSRIRDELMIFETLVENGR